MPNQLVQLDHIFYALGDPTRRAVIERLSKKPTPVSELAALFDMTLPSFMQHLNVLEDCGLARSHKAGRVRTYQLEPKALKAAEQWMAKHRAIWETRLDQLDDYLNTMKETNR